MSLKVNNSLNKDSYVYSNAILFVHIRHLLTRVFVKLELGDPLTAEEQEEKERLLEEVCGLVLDFK